MILGDKNSIWILGPTLKMEQTGFQYLMAMEKEN